MFITGHFIRLFILIELILSPLVPHLSFIKSAHAQATSCPTGYVYDSGVNRCLLTEEAINAAETRDECMEKTGEARGTCIANRANSKENTSTFNYGRNSWAGFISGASAQLVTATLASVVGVSALSKFKLKNPQCKNLSFYGMAGGGAALMGGEIGSIFAFNKKIKEAKEAFDKLKLDSAGVDTTDLDNTKVEAVNLQEAAFDIMIKKEEAAKAAMKTKMTLYNVAFGAYSVAAANAAMEIIQWKVAVTKLRMALKNAAIPKTQTDAACAPPSSLAASTLEKSNLKALRQVTKIKYIGGLSLKGKGLEKEGDDWELVVGSTKPLKIACAGSTNGPAIFTAWENVRLLRSKIFCENKIYRKGVFFDLPKNKPNTYFSFEKISELLKRVSEEFLIINAYAYNPDQSLEEQLQNKGSISSNWATYTSGLLAAAGGVWVGSMDSIMNAGFQTPGGRFIVAGTLGTYSKIIANHAKNKIEETEKHIEQLEKLKAQVTQSGNSLTCTSADRSDPSNPRCYCYNPDNTRNDARGNSEVCSKEWGKAPSLYGKNQRKTYGPANQAGGCVNQQNQFDPQCRCKNTKGPKGGNSCMKSMGGMRFGFPQTANETNMASQAMDLINSGQYDNASLNGFFNQSGAFRRKADAIVKAMKDPQTEKNLKEAEKALVSSLNSSIGGLNLSTPDAGANFAPGMSPKQALEEIKKEMKKPDPSNAPIFEPGVASGSNASDDFNLNMGSDPAGGVEEVMAQNFDYGSNDISKDGSANIFDILSLRYKRSGLRRLFEGEKDSTPDAPNADEINP